MKQTSPLNSMSKIAHKHVLCGSDMTFEFCSHYDSLLWRDLDIDLCLVYGFYSNSTFIIPFGMIQLSLGLFELV